MTMIAITGIVCATIIAESIIGIYKSRADEKKFTAEEKAQKARIEAIRTERARCPGPRA